VDRAQLWHVTLSVSGAAHSANEVRAALQRLADERPFILSGRYDEHHAELSYWEEAEDCGDACALALRLWGEHRRTADLPEWSVCGLEVLAREEYVRREQNHLAEPGTLLPY
jgi:hypothetical protein